MEELVDKAKNGDEEAFTEIIISLEDELYKIARTRFNSEDDICDVVQETIIVAFKNIKKLKKSEYFKTWITKILINNCNKLYQKNKRKNTIEFGDNIVGNTSNNYDNSLDKLNFDNLIKNLKYKERIVLILYYSENLTTKEISKILKEPESTIRNRISRAKLKIKKDLEER